MFQSLIASISVGRDKPVPKVAPCMFWKAIRIVPGSVSKGIGSPVGGKLSAAGAVKSGIYSDKVVWWQRGRGMLVFLALQFGGNS